jgi:hypothetical protein
LNRHRLLALGAAVTIAATAGIAPQLVGAEGGSARPVPSADAIVKAPMVVSSAAAGRETIDATATAAPSLFVPITPYRMYDSRGETTPWVANEQAVYDATTNFEDVQEIPATGVTAVSFNVTIVTDDGSGFVQILTPGGELGATSTVNWTGRGQFVANGGNVGLVTNGLQIYVGGNAAAATDILIDITGYYVAPAA